MKRCARRTHARSMRHKHRMLHTGRGLEVLAWPDKHRWDLETILSRHDIDSISTHDWPRHNVYTYISSLSSSSSSRDKLKRLRRQRVPLTVRDETKPYVRRHRKPWSGRRVNGTLKGDARRLTPSITYSDNVPTAVTGRHGQSDSARRTALSRLDLRRQPLTFFCREGWMTRLSHTLCTAYLHTAQQRHTLSQCHTVTCHKWQCDTVTMWRDLSVHTCWT